MSHQEVWRGFTAGAGDLARSGGWRLEFNPDVDRKVIVPVGGGRPGLASRRVCWLALGGHYEKMTITAPVMWLPTAHIGAAVVGEFGQEVADDDVIANLLGLVAQAVEGCARAAGHPDGHMPPDNLVVISGGVRYRSDREPPGSVDHPDAASKEWVRHRYALGIGAVVAVAGVAHSLAEPQAHAPDI